VVKATGPIASSVAGGVAAASSTPWIAAAAGPIGAAVGAAFAIVASLLAAHEQRLKDAKNENAAVGAAIPSFYSTVQQIVSSLNAGQIQPSDAITGLQQLLQVTQQQLMRFVGTPGTAWNSSQPGVCNSSCTVGCCVYNTWFNPDINGIGKQGVIPVIEQGGGTLNVGGIPTNSYGLPTYPKVTLTINPPGSSTSAAGGLFSGIGGDGSWLMWVAIAGAGVLILPRLMGGGQ
jgi:hypothetical protein